MNDDALIARISRITSRIFINSCLIGIALVFGLFVLFAYRLWDTQGDSTDTDRFHHSFLLLTNDLSQNSTKRIRTMHWNLDGEVKAPISISDNAILLQKLVHRLEERGFDLLRQVQLLLTALYIMLFGVTAATLYMRYSNISVVKRAALHKT